jgi:NAD(P)-dependent dehydrogenase (short-subunit alcohol dehydrogenase family)
MRLDNKTAIITGGGSGIGLSCARTFAREGADVVLFGRRQDKLDQAAKEIGSQALAVQGDITKIDDIERLVSQTIESFNKIDILINNAGVFEMGTLLDTQGDSWQKILDVNIKGVFQLTQAVLPKMLEQKSGSIVNISSILSTIGIAGTLAYSASKGALDQFNRVIAMEHAKDGIRSNSICPGMIETEMTEELRNDKSVITDILNAYPVGRFGLPQEVANACLFLASDEASFITGTVLPVDGGYTAQ